MIRALALLMYGSLLGISALLVPNCHAKPISGLKELVTFNAPGGDRLLRFDLAGRARCMFGDLDVILLDMKYANGSLTLQLSVEALGGTTDEVHYGQPLAEKTASDNLGTYEVKLPASPQPRLYGVFLCSVKKDEAGRVPCSRHKLLTFDQIMSPYKTDSRRLQPGSTETAQPFHGPTSVEPKSYFAQFFVSGTSSLAAIENALSTANDTSLIEFGVPKEEGTRALASSRTFSTALESLPLSAKDNRIQLILPFYSKQKCNGTGG